MLHSCMEEVIALALWDRDTHVLSHTDTHAHRQYTSRASNRRAIRKSRLPKREFALGFWIGHFVWGSHQSIPVLLLQSIPW